MKEISSLSYKSKEMDIALVEQAIKNIIKKGFGCIPAITASELNCKYLGKEYTLLNSQEDIAKYAEVQPYKFVDSEPIFCPAVMEIINKYFNSFHTSHNLYYAPKSIPTSRVHKWLNDDFIGTMENPGI